MVASGRVNNSSLSMIKLHIVILFNMGEENTCNTTCMDLQINFRPVDSYGYKWLQNYGENVLSNFMCRCAFHHGIGIELQPAFAIFPGLHIETSTGRLEVK